MKELLSVSDAARVLGVTPSTVRLMERTGQLPALRTAGGIRLFERVDVEHLARKRAGDEATDRSTVPEPDREDVESP